MKLRIYLTGSGAERVARGDTLYSWDFNVRPEGDEATSKNSTLLTEAEVTLPPHGKCADVAMEYLKQELTEHRANAYQVEKDLNQRINDLLVLPAPTGEA